MAALLLVTAVVSTQHLWADNAEPSVRKGWALWQSQKYAEAEETFAMAVKESPESESAWNGLGWSQFNQGKSVKAVEAFQKCLEIAPSYPAGLNGLGQAQLALRDYEAAEKTLLLAAPNANAAWYGLGKVYLLKGEFEKAVLWWQKIVNVSPKDELAAKLLAAAKAKSLPPELKQLIEPVAAEEQSGSAPGWNLLNQGRANDARSHFENELKAKPEDASALNGLGWTYIGLGEMGKAKPLFERCLKADPEAAGAMNGLARCLKVEGQLAEAIQIWIKLDALTEFPNAGTIMLATTYQEEGDFAKAIPFFERLIKAYPDNPEFKTSLDNAKAASDAKAKPTAK